MYLSHFLIFDQPNWSWLSHLTIHIFLRKKTLKRPSGPIERQAVQSGSVNEAPVAESGELATP